MDVDINGDGKENDHAEDVQSMTTHPKGDGNVNHDKPSKSGSLVAEQSLVMETDKSPSLLPSAFGGDGKPEEPTSNGATSTTITHDPPAIHDNTVATKRPHSSHDLPDRPMLQTQD